MIPVVIDPDQAHDPEGRKAAFETILTVLRAMAENDDRIVKYFRTVSEGRQWTGRNPIQFDIPLGIKIDADEFINSVELELWSRLAKLSWRPFEEARAYVRKLGLKSQLQGIK